jgi:hypothetical protein
MPERKPLTGIEFRSITNPYILVARSRMSRHFPKQYISRGGLAGGEVVVIPQMKICRQGNESKPFRFPADQDGIGLLIAVIALSIFSLLGLYMSLNATTELRISDNYESEVRALFAANAGMAHAREVIRGLRHDDLLKGPDGTYTNTSTYLTTARTAQFRNPMDWATARTANILDPTADLATLPDDGLVNTGLVGAIAGTALIPKIGTAFTATNPYGAGTLTTARYFVKVADNSGDASEIAADPTNNPFVDGDGIIIVRSMGIARTISEVAGGITRRNSVAEVECRFKQSNTFNLSSPLIIEGNNVNATFNGMPWGIAGGASGPGLGTIDTNTADGNHPDQIIRTAVGGTGSITGGGLPSPAIADITAATAADSEKAKLMDPEYLWNFVFNTIPKAADNVYTTDQSWSGGSAPYLGTYDHTKPSNDPSQDPKITYVKGNLSMSGSMTGGGLLVVTGDLKTNGRLTWDGLIIVIGNGYMDAGGLNQGVYGGIFVANITQVGAVAQFGTPSFRMSGNSHIYFDSNALAMSIGLLPPEQMGYRIITSAIDP